MANDDNDFGREGRGGQRHPQQKENGRSDVTKSTEIVGTKRDNAAGYLFHMASPRTRTQNADHSNKQQQDQPTKAQKHKNGKLPKLHNNLTLTSTQGFGPRFYGIPYYPGYDILPYYHTSATSDYAIAIVLL